MKKSKTLSGIRKNGFTTERIAIEFALKCREKTKRDFHNLSDAKIGLYTQIYFDTYKNPFVTHFGGEYVDIFDPTKRYCNQFQGGELLPAGSGLVGRCDFQLTQSQDLIMAVVECDSAEFFNYERNRAGHIRSNMMKKQFGDNLLAIMCDFISQVKPELRKTPIGAEVITGRESRYERREITRCHSQRMDAYLPGTSIIANYFPQRELKIKELHDFGTPDAKIK